MKASDSGSYYAATLNDATQYPCLTQTLEVETCIVGGGYAGLMTALGLLERGHTQIALIEANSIGWGASGRNGGFVFGGYSLSPAAMVAQVGLEKARQLYSLTVDAVNLIRHRVHHYQIDCDLVDQGVILANWFKDQSLLHKSQAFMNEQMGADWQYLSPETMSQLVKTKRYCGGLFEPNAMHFHPLNFAKGIAATIVKKGGLVFENSQVIALDYANAEKMVKTEQGQVRCKNLVIAGGGYLNAICPPIRRSILPIATYVMATEPLGDKLADYINTQAAIYDTRFAFDYYRPLQEGRILWGGRISANTRTPEKLQDLLRNDLAKVFPELNTIKVDFVWDGLMSYARHQMMQLGCLSDRVFYASGFGGHGVAPTTVAGEVLAAAITNQNDRVKQFQPWGLPWNGSLFGPMAAQSSYWWYQFKDWLKEKTE